MLDQWYFEIGDGQTYGPFSLEKLKKWAASGNLMPTHRVRNVESEEWIIAAYVPGLELTTVIPEQVKDATQAAERKSLGTLMRGLGRKGKPAPKTMREAARARDRDGVAQAAAPTASASPPDIVGLCDELLEKAFERSATDVHIDPEESIVLVQLRVDGELETVRKLPKALHSPVVSRFKVLANMDIAERRLPQDGRFARPLGPQKRKVAIRAACLPTTHGERLTLRLLALEVEQLTLNRLGMSKVAYDTFVRHAGKKQGMILLTGPTGSGKSTTLYAALRHRLANYPGRIITVEDPVEYDIVGVAQSEVDAGDKLRFDTALRTILRSDPDVIMIGEIRDFDSVDIAIKAALTGHLVFSSLHTNSAAGVITRLVDMGVLPFQVAATVRLCVAQRLVRKLCPKCRQQRALAPMETQMLARPDLAGAMVYEPGRCEGCEGRGYRGRIGVFELLPVDDDLAARIVAGCDEGAILRYMSEKNIPRLRDDGVQKMLAGDTSFAEVIAVAQQ
jgi:type II secretory ATPase GspE/PulE/Tfp pilus assembly ATPase PilB-like protein